MPNKNKTACKRRIRSRSQDERRRNRTARNGGWSPFRNLHEASETRRRSNVPAKFWLSPRRWNEERKTRNLAVEIARQRAAVQAATHNAATNRAAIDQLQEKQKIQLEIARLNNLILVNREQQKAPRFERMVANRDALITQLKQNTAGNSAVYSERPAPPNHTPMWYL